MNLRDLRYIVSVGELRSFRGAAERCNVSQPSLSAQVKKVEEALGFEIFVRTKRRVDVTPLGEELLEKAQRILDLEADIEALAGQASARLEGQLRLGGILTVAPYIFADVAEIATSEAPGLTLRLVEAKTEQLLAALARDEIDGAFLSLPTEENAFETRPLFEDPFFLALRDDRDAPDGPSVPPGFLQGQRVLLLDEGHCFRTQALDLCARTDARENQVFRATSLETIREFIARNGGMTLLPSIAWRMGDGLAYRRIDDPAYTRTMGLVWRRKSAAHRKLDAFADLLAAHSGRFARGPRD